MPVQTIIGNSADGQGEKRSHKGLTVVLFALAGLAVVARNIWEWQDPLAFDTVKTWIYVRDALTLGPAAVFGTLAVLRTRPWNPANFGIWRRLVQKPRLVIVVLAAIGFLITASIAQWVLFGIPHVVDEAAYLWQAQLLTQGSLSVESGPAAAATIVQYVGDVEGRRITVFFPGSALPLALGYLIGLPQLVNPLLIAVCTALTYWAGQRLYNQRVGMLAAALFVASPFTIFQGASFFGHAWTALLVVPAITFALVPRRSWEPAAIGFLIAGTLLSRPATAASAAVFVSALWLGRAVKQKAWRETLRTVVLAIAGGLPPLFAFFAYNRALTGSWTLTAHRLLLPDETAQLGMRSIRNFALNVLGLAGDHSGLILVGLLLLLPALWSRTPTARLLVGYACLHLGAYSLYYNHGISYGPRYLFELTPLLMAVSAYGLTRLPRLDLRAPALVALASLIAVAGVVPARAHLFHARAEYLDLSAIEAEYGDSPTAVLVSTGPYDFPDPMYPAFVHNGPHPGSQNPVFLKERPGQQCEDAAAFPGRTLYRLNMDQKAAGVDTLSALALYPLCGH